MKSLCYLKNYFVFFAIGLSLVSCSGKKAVTEEQKVASEKTEIVAVEKEVEIPEIIEEKIPPFDIHGALRVEGADLVDADGDFIQLRGMSTHGIAWYPQFVNKDTFKYLRDAWNINCIRLAMYTAENNGYCTGGDKSYLKDLVKKGVDAATDLGLYVIIDWHVLNDRNPLTYVEESIDFFNEMSSLYKNNGNVLYEICNEPNGGASWATISQYANKVIPVIRKNNPNAIVIVGTPTWSQDIHFAKENPLEYKNVMYSLHFYAATHGGWLRDRMEDCIIDGLPVFITEFGICDASGNGAVDLYQAEEWKKIIEKYNVSYMCWNLANKNEASSVIKSTSNKLSNWAPSELSKQGQWISDWFKSEQ